MVIKGVLNVRRAAANRAWIRYQIWRVVRKQPYSRRARVTIAREDRLLELWAIRERWISARKLQNELVKATCPRVSTQTIRNRFHESQLHARIASRVPSELYLDGYNRCSRATHWFAENMGRNDNARPHVARTVKTGVASQ